MLTHKLKEIFIHFGIWKTATSSIQTTLYQESNNIYNTTGLLYPQCWFNSHLPYLNSLCIENPENFESNKLHGRSSKDILKFNKDSEIQIVNEINQKKPQGLILSSEGLHLLTLEDWGRLIKILKKWSNNENCKINLIGYLRHPIKHSISSFQQRYKTGTPQKTINETLYKYKNFLPNLLYNPLVDEIRVYDFDKIISKKENIIKHFFKKLNLPFKDIENRILNESITLECSEILSYINEKCPFFIKESKNINRYFGDLEPLYKIKGQKFSISKKKAKKIWDLNKEFFKKVEEDFGIIYKYYEINDISPKWTKEVLKSIEEQIPLLNPYIQKHTIKFIKKKNWI